MNKKELIEKLESSIEYNIINDYQRVENIALNYAIDLAKQLDEQQKPTVPQYVADYYESIKDDFEYNLYSLCANFNTDKSYSHNDLWWWFTYGVNEPIQTLVKMDILGYNIVGNLSNNDLSKIKETGFYHIKDKDNTPPHYQGKIQPIDLINAQDLNFNLGNVVKYVCRAGKKEGENTLSDLEKAKDYIDFEIERVKK